MEEHSQIVPKDAALMAIARDQRRDFQELIRALKKDCEFIVENLESNTFFNIAGLFEDRLDTVSAYVSASNDTKRSLHYMVEPLNSLKEIIKIFPLVWSADQACKGVKIADWLTEPLKSVIVAYAQLFLDRARAEKL